MEIATYPFRSALGVLELYCMQGFFNQNALRKHCAKVPDVVMGLAASADKYIPVSTIVYKINPDQSRRLFTHEIEGQPKAP
jgi:hypothetical protein